MNTYVNAHMHACMCTHVFPSLAHREGQETAAPYQQWAYLALQPWAPNTHLYKKKPGLLREVAHSRGKEKYKTSLQHFVMTES